MTDYIEAILREQDAQEERRAERDWRKAWEETALPALEETGDGAGDGRTALEEQTDDAPSDKAEAVYPAGWAAAGTETGTSGTSARNTGETEAEAAGLANAGLWESMAAERAVPPGEWAYQALRQSLGALPVSRRESRVVTLQKPGESGKPGGWDAAGLDRLIRRDARRFDGGFQLL